MTNFKQYHFGDIPALVFDVDIDFTFYIENFEWYGNYNDKLKEIIQHGEPKYCGLIFEITQLMGKLGNFKPYYRTTFYERANGMQKVKNTNRKCKLMPKGIDLNIQGLISDEFLYLGHFTMPFTSESYYLIISPNDLYNNYEKLFFPFDRLTWTLLIATFCAASIIIFIVNKMQLWVQCLVYGEGVDIPYYNTVAIIFGISQLRLPNEQFARTIFLLFVWFCLIFRTCYQSMMFEFTTSDMRKPLAETVEDLHEQNYKIYVRFDSYDNIAGAIYLKRDLGSNVVPCTDRRFWAKYEYALQNEDVKYAFLVNSIEHQQYNSTFSNSLSTMGKFSITHMLMIAAIRNSIIFDLLDNAMNKLLPSGIPKYLFDTGKLTFWAPLDLPAEDNRRVFSFDDLEYGFVIWLVFCGISTVVFICEMHALFLRRQLRKLIGLFYFVWLLMMRLKIYHG